MVRGEWEQKVDGGKHMGFRVLACAGLLGRVGLLDTEMGLESGNEGNSWRAMSQSHDVGLMVQIVAGRHGSCRITGREAEHVPPGFNLTRRLPEHCSLAKARPELRRVQSPRPNEPYSNLK